MSHKQKPKKRKIEIIHRDVTELVRKVNTAQIEGDYEEENLCAPSSNICQAHPEVKKYVEQDTFEVRALVNDEGAHTGYAKGGFILDGST